MVWAGLFLLTTEIYQRLTIFSQDFVLLQTKFTSLGGMVWAGLFLLTTEIYQRLTIFSQDFVLVQTKFTFCPPELYVTTC